MTTILKIERQKRNLTAKQVAAELGLSRSAYSNIEAGRRTPSSKTGFALEDYFGIPYRKLITIIETEVENSNITAKEVNNDDSNG